MSTDDRKKPITPVVFTEMETITNQKMQAIITKAFVLQHPEITSPAQSDLAGMIRDEKMMYSNLAIQFTVQYIAADSKRKTQ